MNTRTLCLAILAVCDTTGYEIRKSSMEGRYSYFVDASYGAIYPALNKLETDGCVTCREEMQPGKPPRKVYSITEKGQDELLRSLCERPNKDIFKSEFLLIAMCASKLPRSVIEHAIDVREKQLSEEIELIRTTRDEAQEKGTGWVCDYGLACLGGSLDHLRATRARLIDLAQSERAGESLAAAE